MKYEYLCTSKYGTYFIPCKIVSYGENGIDHVICYRNPETNQMETKRVESKLVVMQRCDDYEFPGYEYGDW